MATTTIQADVRDSKGTAIAGYIRVTLTAPLTIDGVTYQSVPATIPLVAGAATFTLVSTDIEKIPYLFEIIKQSGNPIVEERIRSFEAIVYQSGVPVNLGDLDSTSGVANDSLYASLTAIVRKLYTSDQFWEQAQNEMFPHKGTYSADAWYRRGNLVEFQDDAYLYVAEVSQRGIAPGTNGAIWHKLVGKGTTGSGTTGSNATYDPVGWLNNLDAPSKNAVRNQIELLATKAEVNSKVSANNAALTGIPTAPTAALNTRTSQLANTEFTQQLVDSIRLQLTPVGSIFAYAGTSAPTGFVMADGRTLSRTTYAALFAVLGTSFNTGGEASTDFRVPDLRGRAIAGTDNMSVLRGAAGRLSLATLGASGGVETSALTSGQIPSHSHNTRTRASIREASGFGLTTSSTFVNRVAVYTSDPTVTLPGISTDTEASTSNTGNGEAVSRLQPTLALNYIIATGI